MSEFMRLQTALTEALNLRIEPPDVPITLTRELHELGKMVATGGGLPPSHDRMQEAIVNFRRSLKFQNLAEARLACFGSATCFTPRDPALIEDARAFPHLLNAVDGYSTNARPFRRCYKGLLHTYFCYDGENTESSEGRTNWRKLQEYLNRREPAIHIDGPQPEWVDAIEDNINLLTSDPARKYAARLLEGDSSEIDQLRAQLEIEQGSWLMRKLILAQVTVACDEPDLTFKGRIDALLELVKKDEILLNQCLALILDRYARLELRPQYPPLRDFAIERWGNPTFQRNAAKWSWASEAARSMIGDWAKLDQIRRFFEVLSEDRKTDQKRVEFWQRYYRQIDQMWFALGTAALRSRDPDVVKLRRDMGENLLPLKHAGSPANNAFIMKMGDVVAVEFGLKGNACYLYSEDNLPFVCKGSLTGESLKSEDRITRLLHMDTNAEDWEQRFTHELAKQGIWCNEPDFGTRPRRIERAKVENTRQATPSKKFTRSEFQRFVEVHSMKVVDHTGIGGSLKVKVTNEDMSVALVLTRWGFRYSERRQFWWRKDWKS